MKTDALSSTKSGRPPEQTDRGGAERFWPKPAGQPRRLEPPLQRMYTEEEVAEILQVSLSQLRKWRMKDNQSRQQGPPFRKLGRLVRYPAQALQDYINGNLYDGHSAPGESIDGVHR